MWYAYAILVAVLWGLYAIIESRIIKQYHPLFMFVLGGICWGLVSVCLLFYKRSELLPIFAKAGTRTMAIAITGSLLAIVCANYLFLLALENAPAPNIVMALAYSAPIFTILGSILMFQHEINLMEIIGMVITMIGISFVSLAVK